MVTGFWRLEPSGHTTLPLTDGCPLRKSALITKVQISSHEGRSTLIKTPRHTAGPGQASRCASFLGTADSLGAHVPCLPGDRCHLPAPGEPPIGEGLLGDSRWPLSPSPPVCNLSFREDPVPFLLPTTTNPFARPQSKGKLIKEFLFLARPGLSRFPLVFLEYLKTGREMGRQKGRWISTPEPP